MAEKEDMNRYHKIDNIYNFVSELKSLTENIDSHYNKLKINQKNINEKTNNILDKNIAQRFENSLSLITSMLYSLNNITSNEMDLINKDEELNRIKSINYIDIVSTIDSNIASAIDQINEFQSVLNPQLPISKKSEVYENELNKLFSIKKNIINNMDNYIDFLSSLYNTTNNKIMLNSKNFNNYYLKRFEEETSLLLKKYQNSVSDITEKYENQLQNFILDQDKAIKSTNLFSKSVNDGLKNLAELNERIQNIELEFSKILGTETQKVKDDLNLSRITLMEVIESITTEANTKLNEINNAHTDFINLVSNAGIYKLTENYDKKAKEEKQQYETYRTYTGRAIGAAIAFTVIILTIPLIEYWGAIPAVDTNYYTILARLTISLMFFVLALYFSKQASKHYECYQENHRTFLQLAALEPFMARMTPEEQQEIRKSLVPSYFNQGTEGKFASKGDEVDMAMMFTFMDKLSNFAQNKKDIKPSESAVAENKPQV